MNKIYIFEHHFQLLDLWRKENLKNLHILHLDAHCDLRGLLVNREKRIAYRICLGNRIDDGNFLIFALFEDRLHSIKWVHDRWGGRENDTFTVKYATDRFAAPYKFIHRMLYAKGFPIEYNVIKYEDWHGLDKGEQLDIDWDFFASRRKPKEILKGEIQKFLNQKVGYTPTHTYLCYSPYTSYPSRNEFNDFGFAVAKKFDAKIINL